MWIDHDSVGREIDAIEELREVVEEEGMRGLTDEGMMNDSAVTSADGEFYGNPKGYALSVFDFYVCFTCGRPYNGGKHECAQGVEVCVKGIICENF